MGKGTLHRVLWSVGGLAVSLFVFMLGNYLGSKHENEAGTSPLVSIPELLHRLQSTDPVEQAGALFQLGRHGAAAREYLPAVQEACNSDYERGGDEIFGKNMYLSLEKILQDRQEVERTCQQWHNEWVLVHPVEAAKRGYKLIP